MTVLAVQQGISSLPPTSGQSLTYEYNPATDTYSISARMGPTSFRIPQTIGKGIFNVRAAVSYFGLDDSFGPATYKLSFNDDPGTYYTKFGLDVSAKVWLLNLTGSYGVTNWLDVTLNVPVVVTDVSGSQSFVVRVSNLYQPLPTATATVWPTRTGLNQRLDTFRCLQSMTAQQCLTFRSASMSNLSAARVTNGFQGLGFNEGTNSGVGRISVGAKGIVHDGERVQVALNGEFFAPSPNEAQFAGPDSAAILPRVVGAFKLTDMWRLHTDIGYDYDFDNNELCSFVWNVGASAALQPVTFDFGFGGSKFNEGIKWTPDRAQIGDLQGQQIGTIEVVSDNQLGDNFAQFLAGIKIRLAEKTVLSGAVNVPINDEGFRPVALGTIALEQYF